MDYMSSAKPIDILLVEDNPGDARLAPFSAWAARN